MKKIIGATTCLLGLVVACGPKAGPRELVPIDPKADDAPALELPSIAAVVETERVGPSDGNNPAAKQPIIDVMARENARWMAKVSNLAPDPVYYLSYQVFDQHSITIEADGGALTTDSDDVDRTLDVEVRVGSPALDNTRTIPGDQLGLNSPMTRRGVIPVEFDEKAIQHHLWLETDRRVREATLAMLNVRTANSTMVQKDRDPDFVANPPASYFQPIADLTVDKAAWTERMRACSAKALRGIATRGSCRVDFSLQTTYFVNSEGTTIQLSQPTAQLAVSVGVKAEDGQPLSRTEQRFGVNASDLPSDTEIEKMIASVTADLDRLHDAPLGEPYTGPAILEGRAAGVFFHEVFGHRIEGHRQKDDSSGQTFASYVGKQIMPEWMKVYDDPTLTRLNGTALNGFYHYDDEGVAANRASLIEGGVLKGFVLGRNPITGFPVSNGHGRKQPSQFAVSRQGNLVVEAARSVERATLRQMLIEEIKRQGKPFGLVFTDISGGFTNTSRFGSQAFEVTPVLAYRVYPDGREEMIRGVDIVGTPLTALGSIMAASREVETFNGVCGAESGWVPVSASAPSLLLRQLEIERAYQPIDRPPLLPSPSVKTSQGQ